jgi:hypothetical protein
MNVLKYGENRRSQEYIRACDGVYQYNNKKQLFEVLSKDKVDEMEKKYKQEFNGKDKAYGELVVNGENLLKNVKDVIAYKRTLREICEIAGLGDNILKNKLAILKNVLNFVLSKHLDNMINVDDVKIFETIDEASGGGCLITDVGTHKGQYTSYDINNSYNSFFIDNFLPTNPRFKTVDNIENHIFRLYRLDIDKECITLENNNKFKLKRKWFTTYDIRLFKKFDIGYKLVEEENNAIFFDKVDVDFSFLEKINELKQNTSKEKEPIKYMTIKLFLSSLWGNICRYSLIDEPEEEIDPKYFYNVGRLEKDESTDLPRYIYKNPKCIYKYVFGMFKPFILAYGRYRLLKVVKKCVENDYKVIYSHTDSIITNAPEKYFSIGTEIGDWKIDKQTDKGIEIKNIIYKNWL